MTTYPLKGSGPYEGINGRSSARHVGDIQYMTVAYDCGCTIRTTWLKREHGNVGIFDPSHQTELCKEHAR